MESSIGARKQSDLTQLSLQFKTYRQTYQNRVLPPRNVHTYLQLTNLISQLAPTCLSHYSGILTKEETSSLIQEMMDFNDDVLAKLKYLAEKAQKKETLEPSQKNSMEICRVCLRELRTIEVTTTKDELDSQSELSKTIIRVIKEIEEDSVPFSRDEDINFFKELNFALDKKQEVIELCASESQQFTKVIENQLKELSSLSDMLAMEPRDRDSGPGNKSNELKQNVSKSIKQTIYSKIPSIIAIVARNLKRTWEREKKMKNFNAQTQTIEFQSTKVIDLRRKLVQAESVSSLAIQDREKLSWSIHQKDMMISKVEEELKLEREETIKKEYQLQKEIRQLEQKCKKMRDEVQREKLKSKKELYDRQMSQSIKTMKQLNKKKHVAVMQDDQPKKKIDLQEEELENNSQVDQISKKKTLYNTKGSNKFFLPTLTKINRGESQLMSKSNFEDDRDRNQSLNQTVKTDINKESLISDPIVEKQQKKDKFSKTNTLQKRGKNEVKKMMTIVPNNTKFDNKTPKKNKQKSTNREKSQQKRQNKTEIISQKESRVAETVNFNRVKIVRQSKQATQEPSRLPFITQRNTSREQIGVSLKHTKAPLTPDSKKSVKIVETQEARDSFKQLFDKAKQNKLNNSFTSLNSALSIGHLLPQNKETSKERESILKSTVSRPIKQKSSSRQLSKLHSDSVSGSNFNPMDHRIAENQIENRNFSQRNTYTKGYLTNPYEKINEEIEKESYLTPVIGVQSPGLSTKTELQKRISNSIEKNLEKVLSNMAEGSQQLLRLNYEQFSAIFTNCLTSLRSSQSAPKEGKVPPKPESTQESHKDTCNLQPVSFHSKDRSSYFKEIPGSKAPDNSIFQELSINRMQMTRPVRYSTEMSTLKQKMEEQLKRSPQSIHNNQPKKAMRSIETQTTRYKNKISREHSMELSEKPSKQLSLMKKKEMCQMIKVQPIRVDSNLFINQEKSYEYQSSFAKKLKLAPLAPEVQDYLTELFEHLEEIRFVNTENYQQICGYLRYPFTNSQKGSFHIDILKNLSQSALLQCFQRIMPLHKACKTESGLCPHLHGFKTKISKFMDQFSS